ncbi:MAG: helix-turn-helix transcriptional regulator [Lewinellaceae bacterium]|nr:helix-turn-helix transcriptional regulator [Phaeodactylibacter sp.]MCB9348847.1 helix-turn-helix transcriptional regulator [Lewinellaceae bacterium]
MNNYKLYEQNWLKEVDQIIHANLQNSNFNLMDLAAKLYLSKSTLYRKITKLSGMSPNDYIRKKRLAKAKAMLESGSAYNLGEVARNVGYQRKDYFVKLYIQTYNEPPSALRV